MFHGGAGVVPAQVVRAYGQVACPPSPQREYQAEPVQEKRLEQPFKAVLALAIELTSSDLPIDQLQLKMANIQSQFVKDVYGEIFRPVRKIYTPAKEPKRPRR